MRGGILDLMKDRQQILPENDAEHLKLKNKHQNKCKQKRTGLLRNVQS